MFCFQEETKIFSLMELAEMCARGRIVVAYQVRCHHDLILISLSLFMIRAASMT